MRLIDETSMRCVKTLATSDGIKHTADTIRSPQSVRFAATVCNAGQGIVDLIQLLACLQKENGNGKSPSDRRCHAASVNVELKPRSLRL
jgi:hypothetical protein